MEQKEVFLNDVVEGLSSSPKRLSSKYFYDETGDKLFHKIMNQPEYYLTCSEHEILQSYGEAIFSHINTEGGIRIIEPGAGDGIKTKILIQTLLDGGYECIYNPIDISANVLDILCNSFRKIYPQMLCEPIVGDYENIGGKIIDDGLPRLMLFLGSNLGNYEQNEAVNILKTFGRILNKGDFFLLGVDLVKEPETILAAYNDKNGFTAQFNFNLLNRINRELDANFDISEFTHFPVYNPIEQQAESYLLSKKEQTVTLGAAGKTFSFDAWEAIHTEISRKYSPEKIKSMAVDSGYEVVELYFDIFRNFCCALWRKK
ncbi:MAG: L-histidine N(alpha)-methyltransferase [Bacteroidales bacterium]|nr:L-histidine N(alpha)-methyltransferase [Bacteroidales bacterium]